MDEQAWRLFGGCVVKDLISYLHDCSRHNFIQPDLLHCVNEQLVQLLAPDKSWAFEGTLLRVQLCGSSPRLFIKNILVIQVKSGLGSGDREASDSSCMAPLGCLN